MIMTGNDRFSKILTYKPSFSSNSIKMQQLLCEISLQSTVSQTLTDTPKKSVAQKFVFNSKLLYLCTSNREKASLAPKVSLHRRHIQVSIDVRRRSSMTTKIRARNGASGKLKKQQTKILQICQLLEKL